MAGSTTLNEAAKPTSHSEEWLGRTLEGPIRTVTRERLQWYATSIGSAVAGEPRPPAVNIHTDADYAKTQGWPDVIADGMITANWLQSLLLDHFGRDYLKGGELRTKFIRPIPLGAVVRTWGTITRVEHDGGAITLSLEIRCDTDGATSPYTVGDACVTFNSSSERLV